MQNQASYTPGEVMSGLLSHTAQESPCSSILSTPHLYSVPAPLPAFPSHATRAPWPEGLLQILLQCLRATNLDSVSGRHLAAGYLEILSVPLPDFGFSYV